jgi:hypothetical protein
MKDAERQVREALHRASVPEESQAEARAWRLIEAAYAERGRRRSSHRLRNRVLELALVLALAVAVISPAGASVRHWVANTVDPGIRRARPALTSLPSGGSLLVDSAKGSWVVAADGSKRLLGDYEEASWSPHGLYVVATTRRELTALEPDGTVRWSLSRRGPLRLARWNGPDGYRIAYLSHGNLRVIDGDGTGDRLLARAVADGAAPAWKPGPAHLLAYAEPGGGVVVRSADTGAVIFTAPTPREVFELRWTAAGLLVATAREVELIGAGGGSRWHWRPSPGSHLTAVAAREHGAIAVVTQTHRTSTLSLVRRSGGTERLFTGPGGFSAVEWSPDGAWLLLSWRTADQWIFLNPDRPRRIRAISQISEQFDPGAPGVPQTRFPRPAGWCCSR